MPFTPLNNPASGPFPTDAVTMLPDATTNPVKHEEEQDQNEPPSTPQKRPRAKKQAIDFDPTNADDDENESPSKKTKRSPTKKGGVMGPIPATYEEASSEDKMMIRMREVDGKSWAEIRKTLEDTMQAKIGASSLQIRYTRMKANFVVFDQDDVPVLLQAKKDIEEKMELEKWQRVADAIEEKTGNKYPSSAVQKKFKEVNKGRNGVAA